METLVLVSQCQFYRKLYCWNGRWGLEVAYRHGHVEIQVIVTCVLTLLSYLKKDLAGHWLFLHVSWSWCHHDLKVRKSRRQIVVVCNNNVVATSLGYQSTGSTGSTGSLSGHISFDDSTLQCWLPQWLNWPRNQQTCPCMHHGCYSCTLHHAGLAFLSGMDSRLF